MSSRPNRPPAVSRGRPRKRVIDDAILTAARGLLRDAGADGVTLNAVAVRAGVARATVYRRWPDRTSLLRALVADVDRQPDDPAGSAFAGLPAVIASVNADFARSDLIGLLPQVMRDRLAGDTDAGDPSDPAGPAFAPASRHYAAIRDACLRGGGEGALRPDVDADVVADLIVGGLLSYRMRAGRAASRMDVSRITRLLVEGVRPRPIPPRR